MLEVIVRNFGDGWVIEAEDPRVLARHQDRRVRRDDELRSGLGALFDLFERSDLPRG
jgi:hypothetical protein